MWARKTESQLLPWALQGVELGADTLEIGPGYGANLRVLTNRTPQLTRSRSTRPWPPGSSDSMATGRP
ncbi:methyltransferase [Mycobacteroides abscessus]|nr:methyltransferase [Mycobacteroides abscessus]